PDEVFVLPPARKNFDIAVLYTKTALETATGTGVKVLQPVDKSSRFITQAREDVLSFVSPPATIIYFPSVAAAAPVTATGRSGNLLHSGSLFLLREINNTCDKIPVSFSPPAAI